MELCKVLSTKAFHKVNSIWRTVMFIIVRAYGIAFFFFFENFFIIYM